MNFVNHESSRDQRDLNMKPDEARSLNPAFSSAATPMSERISGACLVVGGSRGIGYALVKHLLELESVTQVIATFRPGSNKQPLLALQQRHGNRLSVLALDVTIDRSLEDFSMYLKTLEGGVSLVIHAAGILQEEGVKPERSLEQCDSRQLSRLFEVNSIGPLMVAQKLVPIQPRSKPFVFLVLSAMVGSIGDNKLGGWYGYRASKAALNQFVKTLSIECNFRLPKAAIVAMHPGTTDTDLSRPFQRNVKPGKLYTPEQTAGRILGLVEKMDSRNSGRFYNWDGTEIPW
jgi:NAD(P)-dependent dehydrogenase (short-subunit alcohol dehydrogenase family)